MLKLVCDKVAVAEDEAEEAEEARDTESKTRTPHKVVGNNIMQLYPGCLHNQISECEVLSPGIAATLQRTLEFS